MMQVWKIGGSLLSLGDLPQRLQPWLQQARQSGTRLLLIAGGGPAADLVRDWDRQFELGEVRAHHLALESLSLTARLLEELLPGTRCIGSRAAAEACWQAGSTAIGSPLELLDELADQGQAAAFEDWQFTTDSIAAWIAGHWRADRLVLLKSVDLPAGDPTQAASAGIVDLHFPQVAAGCAEIGWINMRTPHPEFRPWTV